MITELARALARDRRTRKYVRERPGALKRPRASPRRPRAPLLLVTVLTMTLPSIWVGDSVVSAMPLGATWVRPGPPPVVANCRVPGVMCIAVNQSSRLDITQSNLIIDGQGRTAPGITVNASNVTVQNFRFTNCANNCVWVQGDNITVRNNSISQVYWDGDDIDAMRFFGNNIRILYNTAYDILKGAENGAHIDCAQTWASPSTRSSSNILIEGNYCSDPHFDQCLMAEGPDSTDGGGGGSGDSQIWAVRGNFYSCHAWQTIAFRDIDRAAIENNIFHGTGQKAIQLADDSAHVTIRNNVLGPGYKALVGE